jgi:uncharacterized protein YydD (DUF2326 family)
MNIKPRSVENVYETARTIRDELAKANEIDAAKKLSEAMRCYWATSSEALGEIRSTLLEVRSTVNEHLRHDLLEMLDEALKGADDLWNGCQ